MADKKPIPPSESPARPPDEERTETSKGPDTRPVRPPRPDPQTGEVRAGPGDAGLGNRPEVNAGSSGTKQMSNRRLGIGLGIAAVLAALAFIFAVIF